MDKTVRRRTDKTPRVVFAFIMIYIGSSLTSPRSEPIHRHHRLADACKLQSGWSFFNRALYFLQVL
jgi:hypothetical protein